jgi:hypothetical protein
MTNEAIVEAAARLCIKPTRAPVGSHVWECWADRVQQADMYSRAARGREVGSDWWNEMIFACSIAVSEANSSAV